MVDDEVLTPIRSLIKTLNPGCKILETSLRVSKQSENPYWVVPFDVKEVIATGTYSEETRIKSSGWLRVCMRCHLLTIMGRRFLRRSLRQKSTLTNAVSPNIAVLNTNVNHRYGINSLVYRARLPFHLARLYKLVHDKFVILGPQNEEEEDEEDRHDEGENDKGESKEVS
jgi:hypothetical protein